MGQSQSVPSISNGSPSDSKKSSSASSSSALSEFDGLVPTLPDELEFLIEEKQKDEAKHRGVISITCGRAEFDPADIPEKHGLAMEGCGMIPVQKLTDILRQPNSKYSLLKHNCWAYADETFRLLIKEFSELSETTSEAKQRLQSYLAELPPLQLPGQAFDFHWAWVEIAFTGLLTGAMIFGDYCGAAAVAANRAGLTMLITFGVPLKKIGILGSMALGSSPQVLSIVIGATVSVDIVLGLSWVIFKILRGLPGNLRPDSGLSRFLEWVASLVASIHVFRLQNVPRLRG
ncbi:unnamed protein product [Calypogeia fissa]